VTSGSYISPTFDLTQPLIYNPAFITLKGGIAQAEAALIAGIEGGQSYFNIHTGSVPGGEIRSQLSAVPLSPLPAPLSLVLLGSMLFGFRLMRWRGQSN
jgi:hypothetical protein